MPGAHQPSDTNGGLADNGHAAHLVFDEASDSPMHKVKQRIERLGPITNLPVLITGENGTGKDKVALELHKASPRKDKPFVRMNCASFNENLIESELFGHEKGAFTGATGQKKGKIEIADGGTLFLDEIGDMPLGLQAKLLHVLEKGDEEKATFQRVGGTESVAVTPRIIAATNKNLQEEIRQGRFREDLYYRLHVGHIHLPPLRERKMDIPELAPYFAERAAREYKQEPVTVSPEAITTLKRYDWPGNIRELKNLMVRAMLVAQFERHVITPKVLQEAELELSAGHREVEGHHWEHRPGSNGGDTFGTQVKDRREERGMSRPDLAERLSKMSEQAFTEEHVRQWEENKEVPAQEVVTTLAFVLIVDNDFVPRNKKAAVLTKFFAAANEAREQLAASGHLPPEHTFGTMVRELRVEMGLGQQDLAGRMTEMNEKLGIYRATREVLGETHAEQHPPATAAHVATFAPDHTLTLAEAKKQLSAFCKDVLGEHYRKLIKDKADVSEETVINLFTPSRHHRPNGRVTSAIQELCEEKGRGTECLAYMNAVLHAPKPDGHDKQ